MAHGVRLKKPRGRLISRSIASKSRRFARVMDEAPNVQPHMQGAELTSISDEPQQHDADKVDVDEPRRWLPASKCLRIVRVTSICCLITFLLLSVVTFQSHLGLLSSPTDASQPSAVTRMAQVRWQSMQAALCNPPHRISSHCRRQHPHLPRQ